MGNFTDKDAYRPTTRDFYPSDQAQDTDDTHALEADLEIHAGDDDFDYPVDPEDEGYDSLQSQFRKGRIRKRQRDDIEDAEDDKDAWQGTDTAHLDAGRTQKTLETRLREEERTHPGKKSRTA